MTDILYQMLAQAIQPSTAAYVIAAIGLNIHFGFTGLLNMGQAGFMLMGAYGFAIATVEGAPLWLALLISLGAVTAFALLLGAPTLQLRGDYLAIVTISAAEIVRFVGRNSLLTDVTGGSGGISADDYRGSFGDLSPFGPGRTQIGPFDYLNSSWWLHLVSWFLVAVCILLIWLLARSPWGRLLKGVREDEDAMRSLGKNVYVVKMQALILGGMFGAIGGIIFVLPSSVQPDGMGRQLTFFIWTALLLGGAATIFGPLLGSILFFAARALIQTGADTYIPSGIMSGSQAASFSYIMVGVALMLLVIFRPQGVIGDKRELRFNA